MSVDELIQIRNVSKKYTTGETDFYALKNISLDLKKGEFVIIIGPSGSGKTTLLNLIGGLDYITEGEIYVEDEELDLSDDKKMSDYRKNKIGFVFQSYNLIPILSVYENITMPLILANKEIDHNYIENLMKYLGIQDQKDKFPNKLSGGQQQRAAIARALANRPQIVLADEPTGNLDTKTGYEVLKLMSTSAKKLNSTLVMITHNENLIGFADRVIKIENGEINFDEYNK